MMLKPSYSRKMAKKIGRVMKHQYMQNIIRIGHEDQSASSSDGLNAAAKYDQKGGRSVEKENDVKAGPASLANLRPLAEPHQSIAHDALDRRYTEEFINIKKKINKIVALTPAGFTVDYVPNKYFFFNLRADPLTGSFLMNKIVNAFLKCGKKKTID